MSCSGIVDKARMVRRLCQRGTEAGLLVFRCRRERCNRESKQRCHDAFKYQDGEEQRRQPPPRPESTPDGCIFSLHTSRPAPGAWEVQQGAQNSALIQDEELHSCATKHSSSCSPRWPDPAQTWAWHLTGQCNCVHGSQWPRGPPAF